MPYPIAEYPSFPLADTKMRTVNDGKFHIASVHSIAGQGPLERVLQLGSLYPVYQPIVNLADSSIHAHEALIRGPRGTDLHTPDALLRAAALECLGYEFE